MSQHCREAHLFQELQTADVHSRGPSCGVNGLFDNLSWPLVMVLSLTSLMVTVQGNAIDKIQEVADRWKDQGKETILIDLFHQKLLRKCDHVCAAQRTKLRLDLFPEFARVSVESGFPNDNEFQQLCVAAKLGLINLDGLTKELYREALAYEEVDVLEPMYDPVVFVNSAPPVRAPFIIDSSEEGEAFRKFALDRIRERVSDWQMQVTELQQRAIDHLLDSPAVQQLRRTDRAQMTQQIRSEFEKRGYPLLPAAL